MKPKFFLLLFFALLFSGESIGQTDKKVSESRDFQNSGFPNTGQKNPTAAGFSFKLIPAANNTLCYDIYSDGRLLIHQPSVPGLPGNEGFATAADAEKVARLVIQKLKNGEMPPTVTIEEMKDMRVISQ
jgi:hypothetical protein